MSRDREIPDHLMKGVPDLNAYGSAGIYTCPTMAVSGDCQQQCCVDGPASMPFDGLVNRCATNFYKG